MGIALHEIPQIGALTPVDRRNLARGLREVLPRGVKKSFDDVAAWLATGPWATEATIARLLEIGWLEPDDDRLHADTMERRFAAGAVDGSRMSFAAAADLAVAVRNRIAAVKGEFGGVRLVRAVLYGSAIRSFGNARPDVGDLDLAFEVEVTSPQLQAALARYPAADQWRKAMETSGWTDLLMAGDDRVTVAGSAAKVLDLFWDQLHGRQLMEDRRPPALLRIWEHPTAEQPGVVTLNCPLDEAPPELHRLCNTWAGVLQLLEAHTLRHHGRAQTLEAALTATR